MKIRISAPMLAMQSGTVEPISRMILSIPPALRSELWRRCYSKSLKLLRSLPGNLDHLNRCARPASLLRDFLVAGPGWKVGRWSGVSEKVSSAAHHELSQRTFLNPGRSTKDGMRVSDASQVSIRHIARNPQSM